MGRVIEAQLGCAWAGLGCPMRTSDVMDISNLGMEYFVGRGALLFDAR
jgi:hypothetical protein